MIISDEFKLDYNSFIKSKTKKKQIVLGNTGSYNINYINKKWRNGGKYDKFPHFSIDTNGKVYQHFDIEFYSLFLDCGIDEKIISIGLVNIGQLFRYENNSKIYNINNLEHNGDIYEQKWKGCEIWHPYTIEQFESTIELCRYLLNNTSIEKNVIETNVYRQNIESYKGVCYRSNHHIKHYDLNPSWDFKLFKKTIEDGYNKENV